MRTRVHNNLAVACTERFAPMAGSLIRNGNGALRANINATICILNELGSTLRYHGDFQPRQETVGGKNIHDKEKEKEETLSTLFSAYLHIHVISQD